MFHLFYTYPSELAGEIVVRQPIRSLGVFRDAYGKVWHIEGIANDIAWAVPYDELHPYYRDTSGTSFGFVSQTWKPYKLRHQAEDAGDTGD